MLCCGLEDGRRGHKPRDAEAGKGKEMDSPLEPPEGKQPPP